MVNAESLGFQVLVGQNTSFGYEKNVIGIL